MTRMRCREIYPEGVAGYRGKHKLVVYPQSATRGTTAGEAAMVAIVRHPADPVTIQAFKKCGPELTSFYDAEKAAFFLALDWARVNCPIEGI